jgi:hypothetical protein
MTNHVRHAENRFVIRCYRLVVDPELDSGQKDSKSSRGVQLNTAVEDIQLDTPLYLLALRSDSPRPTNHNQTLESIFRLDRF